MKKIVYNCQVSDLRLDRYLAEKLEDYSRTQIQRFIKSGFVTVDGKIHSPAFRLPPGATIEITIPVIPDRPLSIIPQNIPLEIIYEDEELAVINKQAGLVVHPGAGNPDGTLVNALAYRFQQLSDVNGMQRPGIVHRLDRDTSGLIVVAKTNRAHYHLAQQFEKRQIKKIYIGITWGLWKKKQGNINQPIKRNNSDPTTFTVADNGRPADTNFRIVKSSRYLSHVEFTPLTGRTHQIRVHSSFLGHPIFGDFKYNGGVNRIKGYIPEVSKKLKMLLNSIGRHALHAHKLTFYHPLSKEILSFNSIVPDDMQAILNEMNQDV